MSAHLTKAGRKLRWCHATRREWKKCQEANICVQDIVEQYSTLISSVIWKQTIKIELVISNITFSRDKANCRIRYLIFVWFRSKSKEQLNERWAGLSTFFQLGGSPSSFRFPLPAPQNLSFSNRLSKTDEAYPFLAQWRHFSPRSKEARRHGHSSFQSLIKQNDPSKNNMANFRLRNSHQTN